MEEVFDYIVIGGGSGGVASANRAAMHGAKVLLVEKSRMGGTCVNVGCVPKKIMWTAAHLNHCHHELSFYGFENTSSPKFNWSTLKKNRDAYINRLNKLYFQNLENNKVEVLQGNAKFIEQNTIIVDQKKYTGKKILIAVGGRPITPSIPGASYGIDSNKFFELEEQPKKIAIVGSGYIAIEFAGLLNGLGSDVTLFIRSKKILKNFDELISEQIKNFLLNSGVKIIENSNIKEITSNSGLKEVKTDQATFKFDEVIFAIGRTPNTDLIDIENTGIKLAKSGIVSVDKFQETEIKNVFALGDIIGKFELTPVAIAAGRRLSDRLFGEKKDAYLRYENIPTVLFSHPTAGTIGLTEKQAVQKYGAENIRVFESSFNPMFYAFSNNKITSYIKLIVRAVDDMVIGLHIVGDASDEILQGFAVAINMGAKKSDFDLTVAIHPTIAEEIVTLKKYRIGKN